jgi:hypothetical protein
MFVMFFGSGLPLSSSPLSPFICSIFIEFSPYASFPQQFRQLREIGRDSPRVWQRCRIICAIRPKCCRPIFTKANQSGPL